MNIMFNAALKHLSVKNISIRELRSLLEKEFSSNQDVDEQVNQTIHRLKELHLIDDHNTASSLTQRYLHKGNRFISQKLQQKGIEKETIDSAIEFLPPEFERALPEARKKLRTLQSVESRAKENKLLNFLSSRGFAASTCYQIIDELKGELIS